MRYLLIIFFGLFLAEGMLHAALSIQVAPPKTTGSKVVVKLDLQNTYSTNQITAVRAVVFLLDSENKVVGRSTSWVIGGGKDKPVLEANAKTTYNFLVPTDKPFTKAQVLVERIVLDNGKLANALKDVQITYAP
jgi:hypothetical protein